MQESMGSQSMIQDLNRVGAVAAERLLEAQPLSRWARDVQRLSSQVSGHLWTLVPYGTASVSTLPLMGGEPYRNHVNDPQRGPVPILGQLYRSHENQGRLVILLHGLASTPSDPYLRRMVRALRALNCDVLSIALRGSLGKGTDHYHAGLTDDICAIFADPRLSRYESICLAGYSLGGQIALRYALDHASPRLKGTVALCAPIDMRPCQIALDSPGLTPYRMSILTALKWTYHRLAWNARRCDQAMSCTSGQIRKINSFYEWDENVVCSRYGYPSVEADYQAVSVAPHLGQMTTPTLLVFGADDPIVPLEAIEPYLKAASPAVDVRVTRPGGHLGFSRHLDLGQSAPHGLPKQVAAWIQRLD